MTNTQELQEAQRRILRELPTECIIPNTMQPRKVFEARDLLELSESIKEVGIIQPLTVRYYGEGLYELIAGERRLRACRLAGFSSVPCIILNVGKEKSAIMALTENLQRKDLDCFEQAHGIAALIDELSLTQSEVAGKLGISQPSVANKLRLLKIPLNVQKKIVEGGLCERHARAVLKLSPLDMDKSIDIALKGKMTVVQFEKYIEQLTTEKKKPLKSKMKGFCRDLRLYMNTINHTISLMKDSGIRTKTEKEELEDKIIYKIIINKM